jgi:gliding motility-associated-like protein
MGVSLFPPECFENLGCGTCEFVALDENGCTTSSEIELNCPLELTSDLESTDITCFGFCNGTITGTVEGGTGLLDIVWTLNDEPFSELLDQVSPFAVDQSDLCPGNYELTVTDEFGCTIVELIQITEPFELTTAPDTVHVSCAGLCNGEIISNPSGGTLPYLEECFDVDLNPVDPEDLCSGLYTCTVTDDNGCFVTDSFEIIEPDSIAYELEINNATCFEVCNGSIFILNLTGGSGDLEVELDGDPYNTDVPPDSVGWLDICPGSHTLQISYGNGQCVVTQPDIEITEPEELLLQVVSTNVTCAGFDDGTLEISCAGGSPPINVISPDSVPCPAFLTDLADSTYIVIIEDSLGCQVSTPIVISEPIELTLDILDTTHVVCGGDCNGAFQYFADGGVEPFLVSLNDSLISDQPDELCAGLYELCITDFNTCVICQEVEVFEPDPVDILIFPDNATCTGMFDGTATLFVTGGTGPSELSFDPEGLDLTTLGEGVYYVSAVDSVGCTDQDSIVISVDVVTDMELTLFSTPETCWNTLDGTATIAVTGGFEPITYLWDDPNQQTTATAIGLESDETYSVIIVDSLGCTLDTALLVDPNIGCLFISTVLTPNGDGVNDFWVLGGLEYFPLAHIQVFNRWGQLLYDRVGYSVPWDGKHNGKQLPVADYYFILTVAPSEKPITGAVTIKY